MSDRSTIVIATPHARYDSLERELRSGPALHVVRLREKAEVTAESLAALRPTFVFFPHWSWIIPPEIHTAFECVVFHMTDVPFGRGGSPLQNLIERGIYETQLSALRCTAELDAGPVYLKRPLSLHGSAEEIFVRVAALMSGMIREIVDRRIVPVAQHGEPTVFRRRRPQDGDMAALSRLDKIHDFIRMLDAEGYPPAFLELGKLHLEFSRSRLSHDHVLADVRIKLLPTEEKP